MCRGSSRLPCGRRTTQRPPGPPWRRRWRPFPRLAADAPGLWDELTAMLDPETFAPTLAAGTEIKRFSMRWGNDFAIVARPDHTLHFELQPWEATLMEQMDGTKTTQELIVDHLQAAGDLDPGAVLGLIVALREGGFLDPARPDVQALVQMHLDRASAGPAKAPRLREEPADLLVGRGAVRRGRVPRGGLQVLLPSRVRSCSAPSSRWSVSSRSSSVQQSGRYQLSIHAAPGETLLVPRARRCSSPSRTSSGTRWR